MKKAKSEYRKYQEITLTPVEKAYLESIKEVSKEVKESGKDNVDYVLVFKLSRFGRNAADVLSSLQKIEVETRGNL